MKNNNNLGVRGKLFTASNAAPPAPATLRRLQWRNTCNDTGTYPSRTICPRNKINRGQYSPGLMCPGADLPQG